MKHVCTLLWLLTLFSTGFAIGCGGAAEKQAADELKTLGALVVRDVNKKASSLVLPGDVEKIQQATPLIPKLTHLTSFSAINTPISDDVLVSVGRVKSLTNLDLSGTGITNAGIRHLVGLRKLSSLNLASTKVTSACLADVGKLSDLKILNLAGNTITGGFESLEGCKELTWLVLSHVKLSDADAQTIADFPSLKRLSITPGVEISGAAKSELRKQGIQLDLDDAASAAGDGGGTPE